MSTTKTRVKAVLFDLGDTIFDFGPIKKAEIFAAGARLTQRLSVWQVAGEAGGAATAVTWIGRQV